MQENNFDKRVQDQMEELRFRPSPGVWENVSKELDKRKKRRVLFIFLMTALLLAGSVGIYQGVYKKQELAKEPLASIPVQGKNNNSNTTATTQSNTLPVKDNTAESKLVTNQNEINKENKTVAATTVPSITSAPEKKVESNNNQSQPLYKEANNKVKTEGKKENTRVKVEKPVKAIAENEKNIAQHLEVEKDKQANSATPPTVAKEEKQEQLLQKENEEKISEVVVANLSGDSSVVVKEVEQDSIHTEEVVATVAAIPVVDSNEIALVINKAKKITSSKKIRWATEISAGFSQNEDTRFELPTMNKSAVADYYAAPNYNLGSGNWQGPVGARYTPPSSITGGIGFSAGVIGELKLSPKSSMLAGLQYIYQSNHVRVGNFSGMAVRVENSYASTSVVNGVYRGVQLVDYTNRYHFIQLPVSYQLQLNKGNKTPITWDAGMAAAYLFSTNALTYDSTMGGVYFKDPNVLKRFHINATTGFLLHLKKGDDKKWSFGPQLLLHLRQLDKAEVSRRQYLLYGGFRVRYFFK